MYDVPDETHTGVPHDLPEGVGNIAQYPGEFEHLS